MKKTSIICIIITALFFASCGIEDFPIVPSIPQSYITQQFNDRATVRVPEANNFAGTPFTNFAIFYRIYVSDTPQPSVTETIYATINPVLAQNYNSLKGYIDSTTNITANMDAIFQENGYKYLALQDAVISSVLSSSVFGSILVFDFSSSKAPTMTVGSNTYTLWRSNGGGLFDPQPDRLLINREELWKSENINATLNADVIDKPGISADVRHYTYAAMFIVAVGINAASYSNIYSTPALIHVFQLPD